MKTHENALTCTGIGLIAGDTRVILKSTYYMSVVNSGDVQPKLFVLPNKESQSICRRAASLVSADESQYKSLLQLNNIRFVLHQGKWTIIVIVKSRRLLPKPISRIPGMWVSGTAALVGMVGLSVLGVYAWKTHAKNKEIARLQAEMSHLLVTMTSLNNEKQNTINNIKKILCETDNNEDKIRITSYIEYGSGIVDTSLTVQVGKLKESEKVLSTDLDTIKDEIEKWNVRIKDGDGDKLQWVSKISFDKYG